MASYDERLLASAPIATKSELQEGYNIDILNPRTRSLPVAPRDPSSHGHQAGYVQPIEEKAVMAPRPLPFWRTVKGRLLLAALVVFVIVVAAVGAGVGTHRKRNKVPAGTPKSSAVNAGTANGASTSSPMGHPSETKSTLKPTETGPAPTGPGSGPTFTSSPTTAPPGSLIPTSLSLS